MSARFSRCLFVAWMLIWVSIGACHGQLSAPWSWGPNLGAVGVDFVAITWKTHRAVGFDLRYSLARVYDATGQWEETLTFERHEGVAEIWLQDLMPGSAYRYQLIFYEGDAVYPTEVGSFATLEPSARSFSFVVYGATRSFPDRHKRVADAIAASEAPSVVFHAGGLVEAPTEERFDNFFWATADLARSRPYVTVIGDSDSDGSLYYDYLALPVGGGTEDEQWWSFDVGNVHFVGLDSTVAASDADAMRAQTEWLEDDLARVVGKLIVVFSYDALYSASYADGKNEPLCSAWEPLFRYYGVDVVFSASEACYEHVYRSGIHYVITGGGGAPLIAAPEATAPGTVSRRYGMLHYVRCTFADDSLLIEAIPVASVVDDLIYLVPSGRSIDTVLLRTAE
jgi:hypothetical protein